MTESRQSRKRMPEDDNYDGWCPQVRAASSASSFVDHFDQENDDDNDLSHRPVSAPDFRKKPRTTAAPEYESLQVVSVLRGRDNLGDRIIGPSPIVAIPEHQCFAFMHEDRLSFSSAQAEVIATYLIEMQAERSLSQGIRFAAYSSSNQTFLCLDRNHLKAIDLHKVLASNFSISPQSFQLEAKIRIENFSGFGLAVCDKNQLCYSKVDNYIVSLSMKDWRRVNRVRIPEAYSYKANVLALHEGFLFFNGAGGRTLLKAPIDADGNVLIDSCEVILDKCRQLRAIGFDDCDNLIVAHKGLCRVEVFSPYYDLIGECQPRFPSRDNYRPTDLAVLHTPSWSGSYSFQYEGSSISCSRVIATPDFANNCIVFLGSPFKPLRSQIFD